MTRTHRSASCCTCTSHKGREYCCRQWMGRGRWLTDEGRRLSCCPRPGKCWSHRSSRSAILQSNRSKWHKVSLATSQINQRSRRPKPGSKIFWTPSWFKRRKNIFGGVEVFFIRTNHSVPVLEHSKKTQIRKCDWDRYFYCNKFCAIKHEVMKWKNVLFRPIPKNQLKQKSNNFYRRHFIKRCRGFILISASIDRERDLPFGVAGMKSSVRVLQRNCSPVPSIQT